MNLQKTNDGDLVNFLKTGKRPAFEEIYRRYWYKLFAIAYHHTGIREEAEEIIQEIFSICGGGGPRQTSGTSTCTSLSQ